MRPSVVFLSEEMGYMKPVYKSGDVESCLPCLLKSFPVKKLKIRQVLLNDDEVNSVGRVVERGSNRSRETEKVVSALRSDLQSLP